MTVKSGSISQSVGELVSLALGELGALDALEDSEGLEVAESEACSAIASSLASPESFEAEKGRDMM